MVEEGISLSAFDLSESQGELRQGSYGCKLRYKIRQYKFSSYCLVDSGATGVGFMHQGFSLKHILPLTLLQTPKSSEIIDGRSIASGKITDLFKAFSTINGH